MVSNFKQAWREVFSFSKASGSGAQNETGHGLPQNNLVDTAGGKETAAPKGPDQKEDKPYYKNAPKPRFDESSTTYITRSTIIKGTIQTDGDLKIAGRIEGNVEGRNIALIGGRIIGDVNCTNMEVDDVRIEGNITALEAVHIGKENVILGNVAANRGRVAGKIKGHVTVQQDLEVEAEAVILGDITADLISVQKGAALQGNVIVGREQVNSVAQKIQEANDTLDS